MSATNKNFDGSRHFCSVCQLALSSDAEFAIHEFSKRHCDNLLRQSKNKPAKVKAPKPPPVEKDLSEDKPQVVTQPGNFALYGYFNPEKTIDTQPKEFNTEYDPYLQKLAENPYKQQPDPDVPMVPTTNVTSFSKSKRKKKRSCQICNVAMLNIPEYEAHMKSPQHAWKLKVSGMGVSAHFVKASTDLHTTDAVDEATEGTTTTNSTNSSQAASVPIPIAPGDLYCDVCELLLNSQTQYQAHMIGKTHQDNLKRKEQKNKKATPAPNQLFCYSCRLPLNFLSQYNDHKNGKKHKIKCRQLIREGFTIPPEERPPDMAWSANSSSSPVKYPELYQQEVINKQTAANTSSQPATSITSSAPAPALTPNLMTGMYHCTKCSDRFGTASKLELHLKSHPAVTSNAANVGIVFHNSAQGSSVKNKPVLNAAAGDSGYRCSLCEVSFTSQPPFEMHLNSETHALKIFEVKKSGKSSRDILLKVMEDRKVIRSDRYGRQCCGICAVVSQSDAELEQHLQSLLHKYAEKDYTKKRTMEIQQCVDAEDGAFHCRLCKQSWPKLTAFNAHLHSPEHRNLFWKEHIKKNYIRRWLYVRKPSRAFRMGGRDDEKNPGVRTKVGGTATDLSSGAVEPVPNLEPIEPKIDVAKNVELGVSVRKDPQSKKVKRLLPARRLPGMVYRNFSGPIPKHLRHFRPMPPPVRRPLMPPRPVPPPRMPFLAPRMWPPRPPRFHPYPRHAYPDRGYRMQPPLPPPVPSRMHMGGYGPQRRPYPPAHGDYWQWY